MEKEYLFSVIGFFIAYMSSTFFIDNSKNKDVAEIVAIFYTTIIMIISVYLSTIF